MSIRSRLSLTLLASVALGVALGSAACSGSAGVAEEPTSESVSSDLYGVGNLGVAWPGGKVPVCFDNTDDHAELQEQIPHLLQSTWSAAANITFSGFGACPSSGNYVRVVFAPGTAGTCSATVKCNSNYSCVNGICDSYRGNTSSLGLSGGNPTVTLISHDLSAGKVHFKYEVVHEFGHALGFAHEMQRPDNWDGGVANQCGVSPTDSDYGNYKSTPGGIYLTANYDPQSIMNYCGPGTPNLSAGDILGAAKAYGASTTHYPLVTGLFPTSGPNFGGISVTVTGANFDTAGGTQFTFGGLPAKSVRCSSSTTCTVTTPMAALVPFQETVDVQANVAGNVSLAGPQDQFTDWAGPQDCTASMSCAGHAFGFPDLVISCQGSRDFFVNVGTENQKLAATGTTFTIAANSAPTTIGACIHGGSCTSFSNYEASSTYCGSSTYHPPPTCNGLPQPHCVGVTPHCCGEDGWRCGVCR